MGILCIRRIDITVDVGKDGGVILYIKNEIVSYECTDLNGMESESVWSKL
jgi:hypothetical protein